MGRIDAGFAGPINKDRRIRFLCGVVSHRTRKRPICHALVSDKLDQLPEEVLQHVEECLGCKVEIICV